MLFQMPESKDKDELKRELILSKSCQVCPLKKYKKPDQPITQVDVLVISDKTHQIVDSTVTKHSTAHIFMTECTTLGDPGSPVVQLCCLGRKLDLITKYKPKLVICIGADTFVKIDQECGTGLSYVPDKTPMPTKYKGHEFWMMAVPPFNSIGYIYESLTKIYDCVKTPAKVESNHFAGLHIAMSDQEINAAFDELEQNILNGLDIETNTDRPYRKGAKILTLAIGTYKKTFSFPLFHPQTPVLVNKRLILERLKRLLHRTQIVMHNGPFDLEWLVDLFGEEIAYSTTYHDTMAQAYLLNDNPRRGKDLDSLIRLHFGFNLKDLSNLDRKNLENTPLDLVLKYNGLDTKYTYKLFEKQKTAINIQSLPYNDQIEEIPAVVLMQRMGVPINEPFIQSESTLQNQNMQNSVRAFESLPFVQKFMLDHNGVCSVSSDKDVSILFHNYLGVDPSQSSFDEEYLSTRLMTNGQLEPYAKAILDYREVAKIYETYLRPLNRSINHKDAGKWIFPDDLLHTIFNTMKTATGRLSSQYPNMQNYPSRGGMKYLRNVVKAPPGYVIIAIDYGQMEYRTIAAIAKDLVMIQAIINGLDIHGWWANHLNTVLFPDLFVDTKISIPCQKSKTNHQCLCVKCQLKEFRGTVKNGLVFPFAYGSSAKNVGENIGIKDQHKAQMISNEFWTKHTGVKDWHERLKNELAQNGYIKNWNGRRYRAPLGYNDMINYPIQGGSSDIVVQAMCRLSRMALKDKEPWLRPVLNIHDDLTFLIPIKEVPNALKKIAPTMLDTRHIPWFSVPLLIEISGGTEWGSLKELKSIESTAYYPLNPILP